jgi:hypothetical protein
LRFGGAAEIAGELTLWIDIAMLRLDPHIIYRSAVLFKALM